MDFNAERGKSAAIDSGAAIAGAIAAHALTNFASEKLMASNPTSSIGKYLSLGVVVACIGAQAMGVMPKGNDVIESMLIGATVVSGLDAVRQLTGANDDTKNTAGIAKLVAQYVPALSGVSGLGNAPQMWDYREAPAMLAQAGQGQMMLNAWPAPVQAPAQPAKARMIG